MIKKKNKQVLQTACLESLNNPHIFPKLNAHHYTILTK